MNVTMLSAGFVSSTPVQTDRHVFPATGIVIGWQA